MRTEIFHKIDDRLVPVAAEDSLVIPMDAGDEDLLSTDIWRGLIRQGPLAMLGREEVEDIDEGKEG